jgi:inorganic triphosphatase YgiF
MDGPIHHREALPATSLSAASLRYAIGFSLSPADLQRLRQLPLLAGLGSANSTETRTYYDTPDRDLGEAGLGLYIRRQGRRVVETLESLDAMDENGFEQPVWRADLPHAKPDLKPLGDVETLKGIPRNKLEPFFTYRLSRSRLALQQEGSASIGLFFDSGEIRTGDGRKLSFTEIEIELERGPPRALFDLARELGARAKLRLQMGGKAARGYAFASLKPGKSGHVTERFGRVGLERDMPSEDALATVLRGCLRHMLANDRAALAGDSEGVHQMRVALRRLRVAFSLFKNLMSAEQRDWAVGEIKWLSDALGPGRDWDVFGGIVARVRKSFPRDPDLAILAKAISAQQREAYRGLRQALASRRYGEFALALAAWVETRAWRRQSTLEISVLQVTPAGNLADALLDKRYRSLRKRAKKFDRLDAAGRHALRIVVKKMRYATDMFQSIYPKHPLRRFAGRLEDLQDDLGLLNDIATSEALVRGLKRPKGQEAALKRAVALVKGWCGHTSESRVPKLGKRLKRLREAEPFWQTPE